MYGQFCDMSIYTEKTLSNLPNVIEIDLCGKNNNFEIEIIQWGQPAEKKTPDAGKKGQKSLLTCVHFQRNKCVAKYKDESGACIYQHIIKEKYSNDDNFLKKEGTQRENINPVEGNNTSYESNVNLMTEVKLNNDLIISCNIAGDDKNIDRLSPILMECEYSDGILESSGTSSNADVEIMDDVVIVFTTEPAASKNLYANTEADGQNVSLDKKEEKNKKPTGDYDLETALEPVSINNMSHVLRKEDTEDPWITPDKEKK